MLRTASGSAYVKFHVTAIEGATKENAGRVTVEFAVQPSAGAPFGPTQELVVDVSSGPAYLDLETASLVTADAEWDLWFEGWTIRVNGGVSGSGKAGAVLSGMTFDEVTDASGMGALYKGVAFGGVVVAHPWYRYNLQGNHQIWPTYDVYLIRRGVPSTRCSSSATTARRRAAPCDVPVCAGQVTGNGGSNGRVRARR